MSGYLSKKFFSSSKEMIPFLSTSTQSNNALKNKNNNNNNNNKIYITLLC